MRRTEKWDEYAEAMEDMFEKTDKPNASWNIIASNDKLYAHVKTLKVIISLIEDYFVEHGIELPPYYHEMKENM